MFHPSDFGPEFDRFLGDFYDVLEAQGVDAATRRNVIDGFIRVLQQPVPAAGPVPVSLTGRIAALSGEPIRARLVGEGGTVTTAIAHVHGTPPATDYVCPVEINGVEAGTVTFHADGSGTTTLEGATVPDGSVLLLRGGPHQHITHFELLLCLS